MSDPEDKDLTEPPSSAKPAQTTGSEKRSGRVGFDDRGNSVWEWQLETGVYSRDVSTQKLRKLELNELSIAETAVNKRPAGLEKALLPGGGFNPYDNSSAPEGGPNPYDSARTLGKKLQNEPAAPPVQRKPAGLQRLQEWVKLKKRVWEQKDGDD